MKTAAPTSPAELRDALGDDAGVEVVRQIIAEVADPVLVTDGSGRYVAVNDAACRLTGYRPEELLRMSVGDLTGAVDSDVSDVLWRAFRDQGQQRGEYTLLRRDGTTVRVRYEAMTNVAPGLHASFLAPL